MTTVKDELIDLVASSSCMAFVWQAALQKLVASELASTLDAAVLAIMQQEGEVTVANFEEFVADMIQAVEKMPGMDLLPETRKVCIPYGLAALDEVLVVGISEEIGLRLASQLKYAAVAKGVLPQIPNESFVVKAQAMEGWRRLPAPCFLDDCIKSRVGLTKRMEGTTITCADDVQTIIKDEAP